MQTENHPKDSSKNFSSPIFYRFAQFIGFLLGAKVFVTILLTFALYVSTFFLFNQMESLRSFVFDYKVHGIIFCTILSILAGGIINQFYDREKDQLVKPFRTRIQNFLKQKYFLYSYIILNLVSLTVAFLISPRVLFFFLVYQFLMWFYSHKLAKILVLNNLTFVSLVLYPFFGMLVYYQTFSVKIFLMAVFLFLILLIIDIIKDQLTKKADLLFNYHTFATEFSKRSNVNLVSFLLLLNSVISILLLLKMGVLGFLNGYFIAGIVMFLVLIIFNLKQRKNSYFISLNILRVWIFVGILSMLIDGILIKYS